MRKAAEAAGFEVVVFEPTLRTWLRDAYALINSSHGLIGVHGAALTHSLFLRPRAVFVQVKRLEDSRAKIMYNLRASTYPISRIR